MGVQVGAKAELLQSLVPNQAQSAPLEGSGPNQQKQRGMAQLRSNFPIPPCRRRGELTVKSAYQLIMNFKEQATPGSGTALMNGFWKELWGLCIPPRMKTFIWRACTDALPSKGCLSLKYPVPSVLSKTSSTQWIPRLGAPRAQVHHGVPPPSGLFKLNFDGGKLGDWGRGCGVICRDSNGNIIFSAAKQPDRGLEKIIAEGDCSNIIEHLKKRTHPNTIVGFILNDILCLANKFEFCSFSLVKRTGNRVAHALAHLQPFSPSC
ncbi:hypothetical protein Cgig2_031004 [Carnegiea gigantea]|uniref:RNase H type-1 domain-containing protein n=1 Tax=Carnegiea gigantea TaxID=171969 RepID=A0A9Q1KIK3_9CARY|nr:hypothetical protein Cgig2_031004 [Carnegiea gigantea]